MSNYRDSGLAKYTKPLPSLYGKPLPSLGDKIPVEQFKQNCKTGFFIDNDGHGHPVNKDDMMDDCFFIYPSKIHQIPNDAEFIMWFNR